MQQIVEGIDGMGKHCSLRGHEMEDEKKQRDNRTGFSCIIAFSVNEHEISK